MFPSVNFTAYGPLYTIWLALLLTGPAYMTDPGQCPAGNSVTTTSSTWEYKTSLQWIKLRHVYIRNTEGNVNRVMIFHPEFLDTQYTHNIYTVYTQHTQYTSALSFTCPEMPPTSCSLQTAMCNMSEVHPQGLWLNWFYYTTFFTCPCRCDCNEANVCIWGRFLHLPECLNGACVKYAWWW